MAGDRRDAEPGLDSTIAGQDGATPRAAGTPAPRDAGGASDEGALGDAAARRYELLEEVARGGLGRIVRAWDRRLRRPVAVKELGAAGVGEDRFLREAMITSRLEHPAIVPVHDAGRLPSGRPFYAMKLVSGDSLAEVIKRAMSARDRLALVPHVLAVSEAMAYAHTQGVIHRDLKPHNVLVGPFGETVVIDWGLAKQLGAASSSDAGAPDSGDGAPELTMEGAVMGTPAYMPPEQARGAAVDERADVYALGAMLYHVLAGVAPYRAKSAKELLAALEAGPPRPVAELADCRRELTAIVDKAMARDPAARYPSARELAADLRAYHNGQLVAAHQYSLGDLARRFYRRYRAAVWVGVSLLAALAVVGALSVREIALRGDRAVAARGAAEAKTREARHRTAEALREGARGALARGEPMEARAKTRASLELEDSTAARALWLTLEREPLAWRRDLGAAVYNVGFSPDGATLAVASQDHSISLFDVGTQAVRVLRGQTDQVTSLAWAPDGRRIATGSWNGEVYLWDLRDGTSRVLPGHTAATWALSFSPDGTRLVSGSIDTTVRVWDADSGAPLATWTGHAAEVTRVVFSPDGRTLLSTSSDHDARLWDFPAGTPRATLKAHTQSVQGGDVSPDGKLVATGSWDETVRLWDAASGAPVRVLHGHHGGVQTVRFSPDGRTLASGGADSEILVWDVASGAVRARLRGEFDRVTDLDFSPDGAWLASGSNDNVVRVWNMSAAASAPPARGHALPVVSVAYSPDGRRLATASYDKTVRIWDAATGDEQLVLVGHTQRVYAAAFSPDGARVYSASGDQTARAWDLSTGQELRRFEHAASVYDVAVSPDGRHIATASTDNIARIWDTETGALVHALRGHTDRVYDVTWSHDGRYVASGSYDTTVRVWSAASGEAVHVLRGHTDAVDGLAFTPDGRGLVSGSEDRSVRVWDLASERGRVLGTAAGRVYRLSLDPSGGVAGASGSDGLARLWPLAGGAPLVLEGHRGEVDDVAFSPDGTRVASSSDDAAVRVWDAKTGAPVWFAPVLLAASLELYTHRGWISLRSGQVERAAGGPVEGWRAAAQRARLAAEGDGLCVIDDAGVLERWDVKNDRRGLSESVGHARQVVAPPGGCAVLTDGQARLYTARGPVLLTDGATAIAAAGDEILVAAGRSVFRYDAAGTRVATLDGALGVTAVGRVGDAIVLGFANGNVEPAGRGAHAAFAFRDTPSTPVTRLAEGPLGTVIVGYANGVVGIWDGSNGARLYAARLHGPVAHVALVGSVLYAATELGDFASVDLEAFAADYCAVMRRVWRNVPVVWEEGLLERRAVPADHVCARE